MKKRSFILAAVASATFALAVPLTLNMPQSPITYANSADCRQNGCQGHQKHP